MQQICCMMFLDLFCPADKHLGDLDACRSADGGITVAAGRADGFDLIVICRAGISADVCVSRLGSAIVLCEVFTVGGAKKLVS